MKKTKIYKRIVSMFMTFILLLSLIPSVQAVSFSDVSKSNGFYDEINYLVEKGIIQGFQDGTFKPNNYVTRAQAAIMIGRAVGLDGTQKNTKFPDVSKESVASGYIQSAVNSGIIQGYSDGTFKPNQAVTRGQMAIFLSRAFNLQNTSNVTFSDVSSNMVAYPYIGRLIAAGITNGYTDGTYRPNKAVTRGEFSAFMARALDPSFRLPLSVEDVPIFQNQHGQFYLDGLTLGDTLDTVLNQLDKPNSAHMDDAFTDLLVYEYDHLNVYFYAGQISSIRYEISREMFESQILNRYSGAKYRGENGEIVLYDSTTNHLLLFKEEAGEEIVWFDSADNTFLLYLEEGYYQFIE